jgi:hypothetical protein
MSRPRVGAEEISRVVRQIERLEGVARSGAQTSAMQLAGDFMRMAQRALVAGNEGEALRDLASARIALSCLRTGANSSPAVPPTRHDALEPPSEPRTSLWLR